MGDDTAKPGRVTTPNVVWAALRPGVHQIRVVVTDAAGSTAEASTEITVNPAPSNSPVPEDNPWLGTWQRSDKGSIVDVLTVKAHPDGLELVYSKGEGGAIYARGTGRIQEDAVALNTTGGRGMRISIRMKGRDVIEQTLFHADGTRMAAVEFSRKK